MRRRKDYKYIDHPEIGTIFLEKSARAKRVIIYVKSPDYVRVAVPKHITIKRAESFVDIKLEWIQKVQSKISKRQNLFDNFDIFTVSDRDRLIKRVDYLAHRYNFKYNKLTFRKMKTRWGSCTAKNNISLNKGLVFLSDELKDYVILHELVHTKIKNHSTKFWDELGKIISNPRSVNRKLTSLYRLEKL